MRGVDAVEKKDGGRGGVGVATPYAVSRTGRRCTSNRQWSQWGLIWVARGFVLSITE